MSFVKFLAASPANADARTLAGRLAEMGKLTSFQIESASRRQFDLLRIAGYEVLELLGKGGMGTVYKARHRRMKRIAAVKILSPEVARQEAFVQRFQREVEVIAQLHHPNIVMAYDAGESPVGHFLVMEFINGEDLSCQVQRSGPLKVADAINCILQAAQGLQNAHSQNLIHRDIKPANLLRDVNGVVKVADLGLARVNPLDGEGSGTTLTQAGGIVGTLDYMAPEQALDSTHIDQRADIYSLGCTLYYLLTGKAPYSASSMMALLLKHRDAPIPSINDVCPGVPKAVDSIFRKMVAKKPDDRYTSMSEVIRVFEEARASTELLTAPVEARRASPTGGLPFDATVTADSAEMLEKQISATGETAPAGVMPSVVGRLQYLTVIIVEPSRTQAGIIRKYLQTMGIEKVFVAASGQQVAPDGEAGSGKRRNQCDAPVGYDRCPAGAGDPRRQSLFGSWIPCWPPANPTAANPQAAPGNAPNGGTMQKPFDLRKLAQSIAEATGLAASGISTSAVSVGVSVSRANNENSRCFTSKQRPRIVRHWLATAIAAGTATAIAFTFGQPPPKPPR